jgi:hypothetical protein
VVEGVGCVRGKCRERGERGDEREVEAMHNESRRLIMIELHLFLL